MSERYIAENILNKYYPTERTVFREGILNAMMEYNEELIRTKQQLQAKLKAADEVIETLTKKINNK